MITQLFLGQNDNKSEGDARITVGHDFQDSGFYQQQQCNQVQ